MALALTVCILAAGIALTALAYIIAHTVTDTLWPELWL